ncbi:MAG TPA: hypothetical protein VLC91_17505 [Spongiibacteraceae bacterium]|nr:hypothetical protein [Spongiibacteraceae bacterium]
MLPKKSSFKIILACCINLLTIAANFPEIVLLLALFILAVS